MSRPRRASGYLPCDLAAAGHEIATPTGAGSAAEGRFVERLRRLPDAPGGCGVHVDTVNGPLQPIAGAPAPPLEVPFRALVENVIEGIALVTLDGVLLYGNPRLAQILGRRVDEMTGLNLLKCLDPPWRQVARDALARRRGGLADGYDLDVRLSDGDLRHLHVRGAPLRDANGQVSGSVALIHDDTEHHDAELQLVRMALFDPLTGLPNRATLHDRLTHALARGQRNSGTLALLFCDLDEFKQVNDSLGHAAGDELLRIVAGRLAHAVRPAPYLSGLIETSSAGSAAMSFSCFAKTCPTRPRPFRSPNGCRPHYDLG